MPEGEDAVCFRVELKMSLNYCMLMFESNSGIGDPLSADIDLRPTTRTSLRLNIHTLLLVPLIFLKN